jgi:fructuronate reductase
LSATFADLAGRFEGAALVDAFLDLDEVFPAVLSAHAAFRAAVHGAYGDLVRDGASSLFHTLAAHP